MRPHSQAGTAIRPRAPRLSPPCWGGLDEAIGLHIYIYIYIIYINIYIYIYTYIIHTHIYLHTYIHTYIRHTFYKNA